MKKFLSLIALIATFILATAFTDSVKAQVTKKIVMTSVNTSGDTATFSPIPSHINGFQATVTRLTGLMAGHVWLEGTIDGNWVKLDSFILSDQSINTKIFPVVRSAGTPYFGYRINYRPDSTQTSTLIATYLRRTDE